MARWREATGARPAFRLCLVPTEEEARHAFMRLWREVELLESASEIELAAERWLEASR